jgi:nucleotide-binding universal stress UspA family protein
LLAKEYLQVKNILMTIEDCETTSIASPVVEKTLELASAFSSKVWILHIVPPSRQPPYNVDNKVFRHEVATELRHEHDFLQHLAKCMQNDNIDVTSLLVKGSIISMIWQESERLGIDLVVLGCHKQGLLYSALMDDTDEGLLAKCYRPIMFVPT